MIAKALIDTNIPVLHLKDTIGHTLELMQDCFCPQLPLIDNEDKYLSIVRESDLTDMDEMSTLEDNSHELSFRPAVKADTHFFSIIKIIVDQSLNIVPVIDNEEKLIGVVSLQTLINHFDLSTGIGQPGSIIVLEIKPINYSLAEIARICESDNAIVFNCFTTPNPETGNLEVTLKTNKENVEALVTTFERYNYSVIGVYGSRNDDKEDMRSRFNLLMNYIDM